MKRTVRRNTKALQARIDACTDPIIREILVCYQNGESVETIAQATGMGSETVRKIVREGA